MKLTSVEIHPALSSNAMRLSFRDPQRVDKFNVKAIIGLDADELIPQFYGVSGDEEQNFYEFAIGKRDIIVRVELNPRFNQGETYSGLRDQVYRMISSSRTGMVQVRFLNGEDVVAVVDGFVTKVESPHFEKTQEVQITVSCDDPILRSQFPTEPDVIPLDPAEFVIQDDISTAPHGLAMEFLVTATTTDFIMGDGETWFFAVRPAVGLVAGDKLYFSSEYNSKHVYMVRLGSTLHLADAVHIDSHWPVVFPGENTYKCGEDGWSYLGGSSPASALEIKHISHKHAFWGV